MGRYDMTKTEERRRERMSKAIAGFLEASKTFDVEAPWRIEDWHVLSVMAALGKIAKEV